MIIKEAFYVRENRIVRLFVLSRDHYVSPYYFKYQNRKERSTRENVGLAAAEAAKQSKNWRTHVELYISLHC